MAPGPGIPSGLVDWSNPLNHDASLNVGRIAWFLAAPELFGSQWVDLIKFTHGALTGVTPSSTSGFNATARPGGFGELRLDGSNDYVLFSNNIFDQLIGQSFTISIWFRIDGRSGSYRILLSSANGANNPTLELGISNGNKFHWYNNAGSSGGFIETTVTPATDTWHHLAFVYNYSSTAASCSGEWYLNGVSVYGPVTSNIGAIATRTTGYIGTDGPTDPSDQSWFQGPIDSASIWTRPFSAVEVSDLYREERLGYPTTLNRLDLLFPDAMSLINVSSATVNAAGTTLAIIVDQTVSAASGGWTVSVNGVTFANSVGFSGTEIDLTTYPIAAGETVLLSFDTGTGTVAGASGGRLLSFSNLAVTNNSTVTRPTITSAVTNTAGTAVTLTFSQAVTNNTTLTLRVGGVSKPFSISGANGTTSRVLTLSSYTILTSDTVTLDYADSGSFAIQGTTGGAHLSAFTGMAVTNNVSASTDDGEDNELTVNSMVLYSMTSSWVEVTEAVAGDKVRLTPYGEASPYYFVKATAPTATRGVAIPRSGLTLTLGTSMKLWVMGVGGVGGAVVEVGT